jgi:hypothetical protein
MAAHAAAMPPVIPPRFDEHITPAPPADDSAIAMFNSINHELVRLQQCLLSRP